MAISRSLIVLIIATQNRYTSLYIPVMSVLASHPRYTLALIALLFTVFLIIVNHGFETHPFIYFDDKDDHLGGIVAKLAESERWYDLKIKDRARLILKWGPNPTNIVSYVSSDS